MVRYQTQDLGASVARRRVLWLGGREWVSVREILPPRSLAMRSVVLGLALALLSVPALAQDPAPAPPAATAEKPEITARERLEADKLRPGRGQLESYVTERKGSAIGGDDKRKWESTRDKIDAALQQGDCDGARKLATNEGLHDLAAQIRRACRKS